MAKRKPLLPDYGTVQIKGKIYFRTRLSDDEGNRISLYAASREELYEKVMEVEKQIENKTFRRSTPTVREYCEKWLLMKSANVRETTMIDYRSKVKNHTPISLSTASPPWGCSQSMRWPLQTGS